MAIILFLMSIVSEVFAVYTLLKLNILSFLPNDVLLNDLFIPIVTDISLVVPIVSIALYYWLNARKNKLGELNRKSYFGFFLIVLLIIVPISLFINFNKIVLWFIYIFFVMLNFLLFYGIVKLTEIKDKETTLVKSHL